MHVKGFGERQGFAHQTPEALAQGVVETLDGVGWTSGIRGLVLGCWEHVVIAFQMIGAHRALTVSGRNTSPKEPGGGVIARTQGVGDDLAGAPTEGQPQPDHAPTAVAYEGPQFIQFQDIIRLGSHHSSRQRRRIQGFFFSQAVTVLRDTPKVRLSPRRLLRSA